MDIYKKKSRWKMGLSIFGLLLVLITIFYSNYLAEELKSIEKTQVELWVNALNNISSTNTDKDLGIELDLMEKIDYIPVILEDDKGILQGINFIRDSTITDQEYLQEQLELTINYKNPVINSSAGAGYASKIYYKHSKFFTLITYFPLVQGFLLSTFIVMSYFLFNTSRRAEQNRVWVGMSKETAHQLGTPVSAIMAWIEHLKLTAEDNPEQLEIIAELNKDVNRLELIADRFSKIGSIPKLEKVNIFEELYECKHYMEKRASRRVEFAFPDIDETPIFVNINRHLFDWVIENLLRNALDSMDGKGLISSEVTIVDNMLSIDISDTGSGIPPSNFKTVFQPGFTTKKRGWGLGLALAKRIIEEYHHGKIIVKSSAVNKGTCFNIKLPILA